MDDDLNNLTPEDEATLKQGQPMEKTAPAQHRFMSRQLSKGPVIIGACVALSIMGVAVYGYLSPKGAFAWGTPAEIDKKPGPGQATAIMANAPKGVSIYPAARINVPPETPMTGNSSIPSESGIAPTPANTMATVQSTPQADYQEQMRMQMEMQRQQLQVQREQEAAQREQARQAKMQTIREAASTVYSATENRSNSGGDVQPALNMNSGTGLLQGRLSAANASAYLPNTRMPAISPYEVKAGTVIPSVMLSGINSDLPGEIIAQVVQNVYDSATGKYLLVPQGAKLVGNYDHNLVLGQQRVLITWNRIIYPDSSSVDIQGMAGQDQSGYAGFHDKTNHHAWPAIRQALLLSAISAGAQLSQPRTQRGDYSYSAPQIGAAAMGQQLNQLGMYSYQSRANIAPTITIRPGYRFNVMVNKDMVLAPWQGEAASQPASMLKTAYQQ